MRETLLKVNAFWAIPEKKSTVKFLIEKQYYENLIPLSNFVKLAFPELRRKF